MPRFYSLFLVVFCAIGWTSLFAQVTLPLTFEEEIDYGLNAFEGAESQVIMNPDMTGENTSDRVVETIKTQGAQFFAGTAIRLDGPLDLSEDRTFTLQTWSPKADIPVRLVLETAAGFMEQLFVDVNTTVANQWETLTFDFSDVVDGRDYVTVVVFFEFIDGVPGDGSTYYFDNLRQADPSSVRQIAGATVRAFPNPTGNLDWTIDAGGDLVQRLDLFNAAGQRVRALTPRTPTVRVPTGNLAPGTYLARVRTAGGVGTLRLLKVGR